jgi:hypothetical protein
MNKLGEIGIRTSETKRRMREEAKNRITEMDEGEGEPAATKQDVAKLKRARANKDSDEEGVFEKNKPAPKKRATKVKKEVVDDLNDSGASKTAKKGRKKGVKDEPVDEEGIDGATEIKPKLNVPTKGRKKGLKDEPVDDDGIGASDFQPKAKALAKGRENALKEEPVDEENGLADAAKEVKPKPKATTKKGRKKSLEEPIDEQNGSDASGEIKPKAAAKKPRKKATKKVIEKQPDIENGAEEAVKGEPFEASSSLSAIPTVEDTAMADVPAIASEAQDTEPAAVTVSKAQPKKKGRANNL